MKIDLLSQRLRNQWLARSEFRRPEDIVGWLGAVQSQDYPAAKWGIGLRGNGLTDATVERAFNDGAILRTHILRPTWHFVAPADIRWMLSLSGPRVHAASASSYRKLELDSRTFARSQAALERALRDGTQLTRAELATVLQRAGITSSGQRLAYLMMHAELDGVICSGARRGKQSTYALVAERAPHARMLDRDEALAELARRYFTSHGPATLRDYVWWSGMTVRDAKAGIAMTNPALEQVTIGDLTYWFAPSRSRVPPASSSAYLLPNYDEYLIAYKDRGAVAAAPGTKRLDPESLDAFAHFLVIDGRFAGIWRRTIKTDVVHVEPVPYRRLTGGDRRELTNAAERYGKFLKLPVVLSRF